MINKLKKILIYIFNIPLYFTAKAISKDENLWIFGSWFGDKYGDNSKYLFEYINKNKSHLRCVWITKDKKIIELIRSKGYEVYHKNSFKSLLMSFKAGYSIFSHSNKKDNLVLLNNGKTKLIQLWHGVPLKKIAHDDTIFKKDLKLDALLGKFFPLNIENYDLIIATSEKDKKSFITAFKNKNVSITGYPRNDFLFSNTDRNNEVRNIVYLPTFRNNIGSNVDLFSRYKFEIDKWQQFLEKYNLKFHIKMHPVNKPSKSILERCAKVDKIIFSYGLDAADLLVKSSFLITDYSSVYFDYLLTDKPIIFTPFDFDQYIIKDRELYYDYNEVTPGPKCKDWSETLEWLKKFNQNPELYKKERGYTKNMFHKFQDGDSCERVYQAIKKIQK